MKLQILNIESIEGQIDYNTIYKRIDRQHPYYSLDFIETFSLGLKDARAFVFINGDNKLILMPFYLRRVSDQLNTEHDYFDITSTYGYSGPLFSNHVDEADLRLYWREVDKWSENNHVVSEFIRFNLSGNQLGYSGTCVATLKNVKGKIQDEDLIWKNYDHKVRKNVKRAIKNGLKVKIFTDDITDDIVDQFYSIYSNTMQRLNTKQHFYFGSDNIQEYIKNNKSHSAMALVYKENQPISCELLLLSKNEVFSFLGGTDSEYFKLRPNDLLKHHVIAWAYKFNYKFYVLGGGYGKEDGIFRYKKSFFPNDICTYYTGRKIIHKDLYIQLALQNETFNYSQSTIDFFPAYRKK